MLEAAVRLENAIQFNEALPGGATCGLKSRDCRKDEACYFAPCEAVTTVFSLCVAANVRHHSSANSRVQSAALRQRASASSSSRALAGRDAGFLARQRIKSSSKSEDTGLPNRSEGSTGRSLTWCISTSPSVSQSNNASPVTRK